MESKRYIAEVVSIDDPDKMGRSKIRIFGKHDDKINVPEKDLPWGIPVKATDDPAMKKAGTGGNGLLVGSKVFVEFWDDPNTGQHIYITGSVPKAGDEKKGQTTNGSTSIDTNKSDTPTASRGKDVNPVASNPIKDSKTPPGKDEDEGKNIFNESRNSSKFKDIPSIGASSAKEILQVLKLIDPKNLGGIFPNSTSSLSSVSTINKNNSLEGNKLLISKVFADCFFILFSIYSKDHIMQILHFIVSKDNTLNCPDGTNYIFSTDDAIIEIYKQLMIELKNLDENSDETILTTSDVEVLYDIVKNFVYLNLDINLKNNTLNKPILIQLFYYALELTKINSENNITTSAPTSGLSSIPNVNLTSAIQKFIKSMGILEKKEKELEKIFKDIPNTIEEKFKSIKGLTNPKTGEKNE